MMASLQARPANYSATKTKAMDDARKMQAATLGEAKKTGQDPPKFVLMELIGKGSFGRVYKGYVIQSPSCARLTTPKQGYELSCHCRRKDSRY